MTAQFFTKDDGHRLPVSDEYLLPFLSPTSPGTRYYDPPPPGPITDRQQGRVLLQLHQLLDLIRRVGIELEGKKLLDIGTGNGMIPRLMLEYSELESAVGADPYLSGEFKASWQPHDEDKAFLELRELIHRICPGALSAAKYRHLLGYEHYSLLPAPYEYRAAENKRYRFAKIGAHDLAQLDETFDLFYIKALDHIPDWDGIFRAISSVASPRAAIFIKHFSFFSYLGPHRYATTNIPWGHVLLTDDEYRRFAHEFHREREESMIESYFDGLSYPRTTISGLVETARRNGFITQVVINEPLRHVNKLAGLIDEVEDFWGIVRTNWPGLSGDEMMSGRFHLVLRRG